MLLPFKQCLYQASARERKLRTVQVVHGPWPLELSDAVAQYHAVTTIPFPCPLSARELKVSYVREFDVSVGGDHTET